MSFAYRLGAFAARQMTVKPASLRPARPLASFSFDDFPASAFEVGAPILQRHGVRATYYAAGDFCGRRLDGVDYYDEDMLRAVEAAGHEVGCHSFSHEHGPKFGSTALADDFARNQAFLAAALGREAAPLSFAYPYGEVSARTKRLVAELYPSARGIHPGVNAVATDLAQLKAIALERRSWRPERVERWVAAAKAQTGWLVFFSHDVSDDPTPYGCTGEMLEHALSATLAAGFDIAPVKQALTLAISPQSPALP